MFAKNKQKLKRQDFVCQNSWFQTIIKKPGQLQMQQFQISDCQQSQIYIFDSNAGVFIDDCKYCTIFIGPSQSSIFIRDCHYINIVCITQQFRVRDSTNCNIWLWCQSQPIIQSSHHLIFSCFSTILGYQLLVKQMKQAKLKLWNNNWFDIYDFTPMKYSNTVANYQLRQQTIVNNKKFRDSKPFISNIHKNDNNNNNSNNMDKLYKILNKLKQLKLQTNQQIIPLCIGNKHCLKNGINSYNIVIIHPIPQHGIGLPVLHSRISKYPKQLQLSPQTITKYGQLLNKDILCLFIKIETGQQQKWNNINKNNSNSNKISIICIINDNRNKQILESTVFVPFADQRA